MPSKNETGSACRICSAPLQDTFCDLGSSPPANSYLTPAELSQGKERSFPLHAFVCAVCKLVQLEAFETPGDIFSDYAYFSSFSTTLLEHSRAYTEMIVRRLGLSPERSFVMEIASNDGYLLQNFLQRQIRVLGVEPAANIAEAARAKGVETEVIFFGVASARSIAGTHGQADLLIGNNVIAHVPDLHDFIGGVEAALSPAGTATFEFPHLLHLIEKVQFDTIYHEHFSYFSLSPLVRAFRAHNLEVVDVEEIPTHGGSLRIYVERTGRAVAASVAALLERENAAGLNDMTIYSQFQARVNERRDSFLRFLNAARSQQKSVAGYGAPAKASTLLNYCNVDRELLPYTADVSPHKQGRLLPGSHIPIVPPAVLSEARPDIVFVFAWNLKEEIEKQLHDVTAWGGRFAYLYPTVGLQ